jgi:hypothetical protein
VAIPVLIVDVGAARALSECDLNSGCRGLAPIRYTKIGAESIAYRDCARNGPPIFAAQAGGSLTAS